MGLLDLLFANSESATMQAGARRSLSLTDYQQWVDLGMVQPTASGVVVSPTRAMRLAAVFACVRILAETVASLPLIVYQRDGENKERARDFYLYNLLHDRPNDLMTSFEYRETVQGHLVLWGNAYSHIEYDGAGRISELWPLRPDKVIDIRRDRRRLFYLYIFPDGEPEWFPDDRIWHLRGLSSDGLRGYSPIYLMRQAVGLGQAAEEFGGRFFSGDAHIGGVLEHPGELSDAAYKRLKASWDKAHGGLSRAQKTAILEQGLSWKQVGIPPDSAQFLETRKFQVQEIARAFRIPPHMLADLDRATFSNIEHQSIEFVVHTLRPWLVRWEQSIQQNLMLRQERERYFAEFLVDGLLRGDIKSRYEAYAVGRQNGWLSGNDIRQLENQNAVDGLDDYLVPLNMIPVSSTLTMGMGSEEGAARGEKKEIRNKKKEGRQREQIALMRQRLVAAHRGIFEDTFGRTVRREVADVKRAANKFLKRGELAGFLLWLADFYEEHQGFIRSALAPVMDTYAAAVVRAVQAELGVEEEIQTAGFNERYLEVYALRYTAKERTLLETQIQRAQEEEAEILGAVEAHMDEVDEVRPGQEAGRELLRANNALAVMAYGAFGVRRKRWHTAGDSCPYCNSLSGAVVGVESYFLPAGGAIDVDGRPPMVVSSNMGHPPAHDGCDCLVLAEV